MAAAVPMADLRAALEVMMAAAAVVAAVAAREAAVWVAKAMRVEAVAVVGAEVEERI